jgi:hypothetical protein
MTKCSFCTNTPPEGLTVCTPCRDKIINDALRKYTKKPLEGI